MTRDLEEAGVSAVGDLTRAIDDDARGSRRLLLLLALPRTCRVEVDVYMSVLMECVYPATLLES